MPPQDSPAFFPVLTALLFAWGVVLPVGGGGALLWAADRWLLAGRAGGADATRPTLCVGRCLAWAGAASLAAVPAFAAGLFAVDWAYMRDWLPPIQAARTSREVAAWAAAVGATAAGVHATVWAVWWRALRGGGTGPAVVGTSAVATAVWTVMMFAGFATLAIAPT